MSNDISFTQQELEAFMMALNSWAKSLPKNQQALLERVVLRSQEAGGTLSDEQLKKVSGGAFSLAAGKLSLGGGLLGKIGRPGVGDLGGGGLAGGFWAQWAQKQY